jgi:uncharacterized 2Fe-2S/4Fe-4S cluster protein (DUF4445 family)
MEDAIMDEYVIEFSPAGKRTVASGSDTILDAAMACGVYINASCRGLGRCGKCKVTVTKGIVRTKEAVDENGVYVACRTYPLSDLKILVPEAWILPERQSVDRVEEVKNKPLLGKDACIAVDIGTTSVAAYLVDTLSNKPVGLASAINRQIVYGEDVVSRIEYAKKNGTAKLKSGIVETINDLIADLSKYRDSFSIRGLFAAGNTTMTYLFLDKDPQAIRKNLDLDEFRASYKADARALGLTIDGRVQTMPGISGYVGGDIVGDILTCGINKGTEISMLIDIGTNGEIAIGNKDWLAACSTSAGPAFEGGSIACGIRAGIGAIERVEIDDGVTRYSTVGNEKPIGICGSGLIDLVAALFSGGIIDHEGRFKGESKEYVVVPKEDSGSGKDIRITESDIENIILSKAALYAGAVTMTKIGIPFHELDKIYVAGDFGYHIDYENAVTIGLLPDLPKEKYQFIGNGSLKGALMAMTSEEKRKDAEKIAAKATYVDLSGNKAFSAEYMDALYLPHKDMTRFPSVDKRIR